MQRGAQATDRLRLSGRWPGRTRCSWSDPAVLHLLWTGRLRADLRRPLGAATPVRLAAGADVMSGQVLSIAPGSRLSFDGNVVEVVAVDGVRVDAPQRPDNPVRDRAALQAGGVGAPAGGCPFGPVMRRVPGLASARPDRGAAGAASERAGHVREVLTGFRPVIRTGRSRRAASGYRARQPLKARYQAKARRARESASGRSSGG